MKSQQIIPLLSPFSGGIVPVGFSGGADSTAALLVTLEAADACGITVVAVHFEHGLRGDVGRADAEYCRAFCRDRQIPFRLVGLEVPAHRRPRESVEAAARRLRLEAWRRLAGELPCRAAVLGHQADDLRENLLLRLARGANASGAAGLRERTRIGALTLLRPLLRTTRREIEVFLRERGIDAWREDASNRDWSIPRNYLRGKLLPEWFRVMPAAGDGLLRALEALQADAVWLEREARRRYRRLPRNADGIDAARWAALPDALGFRVFRYWLAESDHAEAPPPNRHLYDRFRVLLDAGDAKIRRLPLPDGRVLERRRGRLRMVPPSPPPPPVVWHWRDCPETAAGEYRFTVDFPAGLPADVPLNEAYFDADRLPETLLLAPVSPGETIVPFGRTRPEKLKKLRIDRRIPPDRLPPALRLADRTMLWAPQVRHGAAASVTGITRQIARFRLEIPVRQTAASAAGSTPATAASSR